MKALSGVPTALLGLALIGSQPAAAQQPAAKPASDLELPFQGLVTTGTFGFSVTHAGAKGVGLFGSGFYGVFGESKTPGGTGIFGGATGAGSAGVDGRSKNGGIGVYGAGKTGVRGVTADMSGTGVIGISLAAATEDRNATIPYGTGRTGVFGGAIGAGSAGVDGRAADGIGVYGQGVTGVRGVTGNPQGTGVIGIFIEASSDPNRVITTPFGTGRTGVFGGASGEGAAGVDGRSDLGVGVYGGGATGVRGVTSNAAGSGVVGVYTPAEGKNRIGSISFNEDKSESRGRLGAATSGVEGFSNLAGGSAVVGKYAKLTEGMLGGELNAVVGKSTVAGGKGVAGRADVGANAVGVYGESAAGLAGFFRGKVTITDRLLVTRIDAEQVYAAKGLIGGIGKMFKIDHPLEPAEKYLWHASVESDDRKNMYDGVVTLDARGAGWITLPDWFQALNKDFRYQLTCIGGYAPVYIAEEIKNNRFRIAGGKAGLKVSWQVTGVRQDGLAKANPLKVEEAKRPADRGRYLNPSELGFPASLGISQPGTPVPSIAPSPR